ncbi:uncharacterized protein BKA55DRAFT_698336 [Fusarium redolens]|uniref:Uncharacterized protein n=1 Tax=Fusarium redolens TaxID=48865 RepID=A0A9P9FW24_FUSRE|nr:uncharacterized protein BKA55DRAFT_698336 [Fusarium redolens]KAH7207790.1 hypothetical protein BKA55DRAFT_698336 [Fusarium redolens]
MLLSQIRLVSQMYDLRHATGYCAHLDVISAQDKEIKSFVEGELNRRTATMNLDEAIRKHIQDVIVHGAQGMHLWVVLQLNALFPLYGDTLIVIGDFVNFLDRLPSRLSESFEEALGNIQDDRYGSRIFELVAAVIRPLTKNELRSALNFEPGVPLWNDSTLLLHVNAMVYQLWRWTPILIAP